jgi:hypothetical protein
VAGTIKLVAVLNVLPALLGLNEREVGVHIAVRLLGGGDLVDDGVGALLEFGVALAGEGVGDPFEDLVNVRVVIESALVFASDELARHGEVLDPPGDFALMQVGLDRHRPVGREARAPEGIGDLHILKRYGRQALRTSGRCQRGHSQEQHTTREAE